MNWHHLAAGSLIPAGLALTWLVQSTVLLAAGLVAGRLLRKWGPAVQSALYRTALAAVILCPIASVSMAALGFSGLLIRLPGPSENDRTTPAGKSPRQAYRRRWAATRRDTSLTTRSRR